MPVVSLLALSDAVMGLLNAHPTLTAYDTIVEPAPPVDEGGVVMGYAVFYPGAGDAGVTGERDGNLAAIPGKLLWTFQVTCAGGDRGYASWVVDAVRGLIDGRTLTVAGTNVGRMQPPLGYTPPMLQNPSVQPPRVSVPLQYQVLAAPAVDLA